MKTQLYKLVPVFAIGMMANFSTAQGLYVNLNLGYGTVLASQTGYLFSNTTEGANSTSYENVKASLGKGVNFGAAIGKMFTKNVGAELGFSYLMGGKTNTTDVYYGGGSTTDKYSWWANMLRIMPSIVVAAGGEKTNLYAKFGAVIGTGTVWRTMQSTDNDNGDVRKQTMQMNGGVALGLHSAVGVIFNMSKKVTFFGEINMVNMSYAPSKGKITEASKNGKDVLPDMTTREKETNFSDSYTQNKGKQPDSEPSKELKMALPFGSVGLAFGVRIGIGN